MKQTVTVRSVVVTAIVVLSSVAMAGMVVAAEKNAYMLEEAPQEAAEVIATREAAKDLQPVVVVGRIGGRTNPWIKGVAAFSIVDRSLTPCNEIEGDTCPTPWDYCCEAVLPKATVFVTFVDGDGKVVKQDARELLGVKELDTVFIEGKAKRDKAGNVTVVASKVFIPSDEKETQ